MLVDRQSYSNHQHAVVRYALIAEIHVISFQDTVYITFAGYRRKDTVCNAGLRIQDTEVLKDTSVVMQDKEVLHYT